MTLDAIVRELRRVDQLGTLHNKFAQLPTPRVLIVDLSGWNMPTRTGFSQLINRLYARSAMMVTSKAVGAVGYEVQAVTRLDRLLHVAEILTVVANPESRRPPRHIPKDAARFP